MKYGPHHNEGAILAEMKRNRTGNDVDEADKSMEDNSADNSATIPETPTPSSRKQAEHAKDAPPPSEGGNRSPVDTDQPKSRQSVPADDTCVDKDGHDAVPDDIFTPPGSAESADEVQVTRPAPAPESRSDREVIKALFFKKLGKHKEHEEPLSATQAMRQVEIAAARAQYNNAVEAKSQNGAIDKAMLLSRAYLDELHSEMKANEAALIETLKGSNPDVVFVPNHVNPPVFLRRHAGSNEGQPGGLKRKHSAERMPVPLTKKQKQAEVAKYLDLEAKESSKEGWIEIMGKVRSSRGRIKSRATVTTSDDKDAEAYAMSGQEVRIKDAVEAKKAEKKSAKEKLEKLDDGENMTVDPTCVFHVEKPDLSRKREMARHHFSPQARNHPSWVISRLKREMALMLNAITSSQFNWGDVLAISAVNSIACWRFDSDELTRRPGSASLGPHLNYVRALIADKEMMHLRLQTAPRLIQVSSTDPLGTRDRLDWVLIKTSAEYPWLKKNAVFKALHSMCCRSDLNKQWTSHSVLKVNIRNAHAALHDLLSDSYRIVTFERDHASHVVRTEGEDGVDKSMVSMGGHITWLVNQVDSVDEGEAVNSKRIRAMPSTVKALQKKYLNVFLGLNLIYKSKVHNGIINKAASKGSSKKTLATLRSTQKASSVLQQLYNDRNMYSSAGLKSLHGGSKPPPLIAPAPTQSGPAPSNASQQEKSSADKVSADTSRDISNTKKQCLHSLSLFLMFGTAGLFHVIPNWKDASMPETATLLHLSSLLSDRRFEHTKDEPHPFGTRAWKFMLDLLTETHRPGLSLGLDGCVMDHVQVDSVKLFKLNSPAMESFRALWGQTEGPAYPVTDRGASLYPKLASRHNAAPPAATVGEDQDAEDDEDDIEDESVEYSEDEAIEE
ncbi:hypothetical protein DFH28DRAFT_1139527 [Melampsora americana]|nr:hypothetical protein DFH28DRAFT_1139527 [Melampsora americana]